MRALRSGALLFRKDLRVLVRSRGLLAVLIGYPIVIAILLAIALSGGDRRPGVAFVNLDAASGRTGQVGDERLSVDDYATRLEDDVDLVRLDPAQAEEALAAGRVSAVLTVPRGFIADLQSGLKPPVLQLATNPRSPIEAQAIERNLESAVFRLNQALATAYVTQVLNLVDLIQDGGTVGIFGRSGTLLGLNESSTELARVQAQLRRDGRGALANRLGPLRDYISGVGENLELAKPAAQAIASPIKLEISEGAPGREPLSALGIAGALVVGIGLVLAGETTHDRYLCEGVAHGFAAITAQTGKPVAFGVLTCQTIEQASARAGGAKGNKGSEAMLAAIIAAHAVKRVMQLPLGRPA